MKLEYLKKLNIPDTPGVYFFLKGKEIIYTGKATSLRDRVKSYFNKDVIATRGPVIVEMVFQADRLDWRSTDSVLEALILEASLIKAHQPRYNTKEKSDKSWNYVVITKEEIPKVLVVRQKDLERLGAHDFSPLRPGSRDPRGFKISSTSAFGPFTHSTQLREALKIIRHIFPYLDDASSKKQNYQFYKQINLAPDVNLKEGIEHYQNNIKYIKLFFKGKKKDILRSLKKDMIQAAKSREFERAGEIKRQIFALEHINDVALLKNENYSKERAGGLVFRIEAYDIAHMSGKNMVGVMTVVENNSAVKSEYKRFKIRTQENTNDTGALTEVLKRRLAHTEWTYPNLIVVDGGVAQINAATSVLKSLGVDIPVVSVLKDERHKPKAIQGDGEMAKENKSAIVLANSEAHRFAINYHKNMRGKNFLPQMKKAKKKQ